MLREKYEKIKVTMQEHKKIYYTNESQVCNRPRKIREIVDFCIIKILL